MHAHFASFDHLESRSLLAATATLDGRTVTITGTPDNDSVHFVRNAGYDLLRIQITTTLISDGTTSTAQFDFGDHNALRIVMDLGAGSDANDLYDVYQGPKNRRMTILGCAGDDHLVAGLGNDFIDAGEGNDFVSGSDGNDTILGGGGRDRIEAGAGDDRVEGGAGNDSLYGDTGDDRLYGGTGNDNIYGEAGRNRLSGDAGDDNLFGGAQRDWLYGGVGDDRLDGGGSDNYLNGGNGNDQGRTRNRRFAHALVSIESVI